MFGPVFTLELLRERRRGRSWRLLSWAYAGLLAFPIPDVTGRDDQVQLVIAKHFLLLLLLTPVLMASALGEEKARGTLADLFTTALTAAEILAGKLLARALRVVNLMLPSLPVLFFLGGSVGLSLHFFAAALLMSVLVILGVGALGLLCAAAIKRPSAAVLAAYALVGMGGLAVCLIPVRALDPVETLAPASHDDAPHAAALRLGVASLAWLAVAAIGFALAVWRLRPDGLRHMHDSVVSRPARAGARPPVGDDPIRWRAVHCEGLAPLPLFRRFPRTLGVLATAAVAATASGFSASESIKYWRRFGHSDPWFFCLQALGLLFAAILVVTVRAGGAITTEREGDTWESLCATPLSGRRLLRGKLRGILDSAIPYYIAYALPSALLSLTGGPLGLVVTVTSLLAAWPVMYFAAVMGLWASVEARGTGRSVIAAIGGVVGIIAVFSFGNWLIVGLLFMLVDQLDELRRPGEVVVIVTGYCVCAIASSLLLTALARAFQRKAEAEALTALESAE